MDLPLDTLLLSIAPQLIYGFIGVVLLLQRRWRTLLALTITYFGLVTTPLWWPPTPTSPAPETTRLAIFNAQMHGSNTAKQADTLPALQADVIGIVEASPNWKTQLKFLSAQYPFHNKSQLGTRVGRQVYQDNFLVLSRHPITEIAAFQGQSKLFHIAAPQPFHLHLVHPFAPFTKTLRNARNRWLKDVAGYTFPSHTIHAGDFNAVPWDPALANFVKTQNLTYANLWLPTYHTKLPTVPIDHILFPNNTTTTHTTRLHLPTADHFGLMTDITQPAQISPSLNPQP